MTGAADWHINADEPDVLDYDTSFKPPAQDALYEPNQYRSSDHDPIVVTLGADLTPCATDGSRRGGRRSTCSGRRTTSTSPSQVEDVVDKVDEGASTKSPDDREGAAGHARRRAGDNEARIKREHRRTTSVMRRSTSIVQGSLRGGRDRRGEAGRGDVYDDRRGRADDCGNSTTEAVARRSRMPLAK